LPLRDERTLRQVVGTLAEADFAIARQPHCCPTQLKITVLGGLRA
jgi:hypothetical protein